MAKHQIRKAFWHKGWVFLFSIVDTNGIWSTHETGDAENMGGSHYAQKFQAAHDDQIDDLHAKSIKEEELKIAAEGIIVDDKTDESRQILKQRN